MSDIVERLNNLLLEEINPSNPCPEEEMIQNIQLCHDAMHCALGEIERLRKEVEQKDALLTNVLRENAMLKDEFQHQNKWLDINEHEPPKDGTYFDGIVGVHRITNLFYKDGNLWRFWPESYETKQCHHEWGSLLKYWMLPPTIPTGNQ